MKLEILGYSFPLYYIFIPLVVLLVSVFEHSILSTGLLLFYAGPCNDDCASDAPGSGGGSSCGSGGGTDGTGGPAGCDGDCGGDGEFGDTSTPYLYVKTKDGQMAMQNDVMIGMPLTYVKTKTEGMDRYNSAMLGTDIYPVSLTEIDYYKGLELQIREIEPEESFIYNLKAHFYNLEDSKVIIQDWKHQSLHAFEKEKIKLIEDTVLLNRRENVQPCFGAKKYASHYEEKNHAVRVEKGDELTFKVRREGEGANGIFLIVSSFWRNWVAGMTADEIHKLAPNLNASPLFNEIHAQTRRLFSRTASIFAVLSGMLLGGASLQDDSTQKNDDLLTFIKNTNFVQQAHADTPHPSDSDGASLRIAYKHPILEMYVHFATIQPRAYMPTDISVSIPQEAFDLDGEAEIMIEATKGHYIKNISLVESETAEIYPECTKIFNTAELNGESVESLVNKKDKPLHMVAGDVLSLKTTEINNNYTHFALEIYGFYTPLTTEMKRKIGDWESNLEPREKELIKSMQS